jgi:hypothetical protein
MKLEIKLQIKLQMKILQLLQFQQKILKIPCIPRRIPRIPMNPRKWIWMKQIRILNHRWRAEENLEVKPRNQQKKVKQQKKIQICVF